MSLKGKEYHTTWRVLVGCSSPLLRPWAGRSINHLSLTVTHGQCDARPTVTFPVAEHRCAATGTKLYCLVAEAHAQSRYLTAGRPGIEFASSRVASQHLNHYTTRPHSLSLLMCSPIDGIQPSTNVPLHALILYDFQHTTACLWFRSHVTPNSLGQFFVSSNTTVDRVIHASLSDQRDSSPIKKLYWLKQYRLAWCIRTFVDFVTFFTTTKFSGWLIN